MGWLGPEEWQAVMLSLRVSFWATLVALPFGLFTAYALARWRFPGRQLLNGLVHLPLILPPVVTGYLLLLVFNGRFDEIRAERAVHESLLRIERLVLALPPHDPSPTPMGKVIRLSRRR